MPPRPPPPPNVLTVLSGLSALAAAWLAVAIEQAGVALGSLIVGVPLHGLALDGHTRLVAAVLGPASSGPGALVLVAVAGAGLLLVTALGAHGVLARLRVAGWVRSLGLSLVVLALLWVPTVLFAALVRGGGPVAALYAALGDPPAGRWAAGGLALLLLWLVAGPVSRRAIGTGRAWMRVDGTVFRRRLVRVVVGYPAAVALIGLAAVLGWMPLGWSVAWSAGVLVALVHRTG